MCANCHPNPGQALVDFKDEGWDLGDIGDVRKLMGEDADGYTDEELMEMGRHADRFADAVFDWWQHRRNRDEPKQNS